jgi:hypothetical protein
MVAMVLDNSTGSGSFGAPGWSAIVQDPLVRNRNKAAPEGAAALEEFSARAVTSLWTTAKAALY